jgi:glycine C-acetyltransferase/8-amino-7-oxononanoate synthase
MEAVCREFGAMLLVDEAHALGVVGRHGQGLITELGLNRRVALQMGTFSKAAGIAGGYVCGSREVIDLLINKARSFIFSTAPPPAFVYALQRVFEWLDTSDGAARVARMWENTRVLGEILDLRDPQSPILPYGRMSEKAVLAVAGDLLERGLYAPAVRYPTVPRDEARLRFSVSAIHEPRHLEAVRAWKSTPREEPEAV